MGELVNGGGGEAEIFGDGKGDASRSGVCAFCGCPSRILPLQEFDCELLCAFCLEHAEAAHQSRKARMQTWSTQVATEMLLALRLGASSRFPGWERRVTLLKPSC